MCWVKILPSGLLVLVGMKTGGRDAIGVATGGWVRVLGDVLWDLELGVDLC